MKQGRVQIVYVNWIARDVVVEIVRFAVSDAATDAAACHPDDPVPLRADQCLGIGLVTEWVALNADPILGGRVVRNARPAPPIVSQGGSLRQSSPAWKLLART